MNFKLIGEVRPKHSKEIKRSRIGIGLEKLDRSLYDPEKCYDAIGKLGVGYVRHPVRLDEDRKGKRRLRLFVA